MKEQRTDALLITGGQVVTADDVRPMSIAINGGVIEQFLHTEAAESEWLDQHTNVIIVNAANKYVLPGLIDIHCDMIEKEVQPRPNTLFPLDMALLEFERKLPVHGITTMFHSLSLGVGLSLRGDHLLTGMVDTIHRFRQEREMIRNLIHLRFEVSYHPGLPIVKQYIEEGKIDYLSYMDHSPGQGQYRAPGSFERYVMKNQGVTLAEVQDIVDDLMERRTQIRWDELKEIGQLAAVKGIAVASHDDDTIEKVEQLGEYGITISEFPINMETAKHAAKLGMKVCVGAPNVVRGGSHDQNLSAAEAIREGAAQILCSDYHPSSLLAAVFKLVKEGAATLPEAVRMATLYPAEALHMNAMLGSIALGKAADLIVVDRYHSLPWVTDTIVDGKLIYQAKLRSEGR